MVIAIISILGLQSLQFVGCYDLTRAYLRLQRRQRDLFRDAVRYRIQLRNVRVNRGDHVVNGVVHVLIVEQKRGFEQPILGALVCEFRRRKYIQTSRMVKYY